LVHQHIVLVVLIDIGSVNSFITVLFLDLDFKLLGDISEVYFDSFDEHWFIEMDIDFDCFLNIHFTAPILIDVTVKYIVDPMFSIFKSAVARYTDHIPRI